MTEDGFDAMGKPIPFDRRQAAFDAVREMIPDVSTEDAMALIGRVAEALERDEPYEAMREATHGPIGRDPNIQREVIPTTKVCLDETGGFRLLAHLLTDPPPQKEEGPVVTGPYPYSDKSGHEYLKTTVKDGSTITHHVFKTPEIAEQETEKIKKELKIK